VRWWRQHDLLQHGEFLGKDSHRRSTVFPGGVGPFPAWRACTARAGRPRSPRTRGRSLPGAQRQLRERSNRNDRSTPRHRQDRTRCRTAAVSRRVHGTAACRRAADDRIELLTAHPGNARRDISLDQEFLDSIAELGILTPLRVTPDGGLGYLVIEGHRRLAAAVKLGLTEVPYDLAADRESDVAGQFLDMYAVNHHRKPFTPLEEADALFGASTHGATKTRIRKATGLGKEDVTAALQAGGMTGLARETAAGLGHNITLDQLALLAEFEDDSSAVSRLMNDFCGGRSGQHTAERIRQERTEQAEHERLLAQLTADGYTIAADPPPFAHTLSSLRHDGQDLTEETHSRRQRP
jgi:ParB-like nuclease domain